MIKTRRELEFCLKADSIMNEQVFPQKWWKKVLFPSLIRKWLVTYRKADYYYHKSKQNKLYIALYVYYRLKYHRLSQKTRFDIPLFCLGYGGRIGHLSNIIINGKTKIGNYCCLSNNITIADGNPKIIGNQCFIGSNVVIAKNITIADGCTISSCSFMNSNALNINTLLVGKS